MSKLDVSTVMIVGAGFSHHAGLPLTSRFTEAMLAAREFSGGPSRLIVDFLSKFIHAAFDHSTKAGAKYWPELEDIFTCVDLSANSGHHFGSAFAPADLRTVRRAMLSRIIRMLDQRYQEARKKKDADWKKLDDLFSHLDFQKTGFISMNWDTIIERKLALARNMRIDRLFDYCCDAIPANIPDALDEEEFSSRTAFLKAIEVGQTITTAANRVDSEVAETRVPVVKMHGSVNWLYCDNCRRVFWVPPDQSGRIASQLIRKDDLPRIEATVLKKGKYTDRTLERLRLQPPLKCKCSLNVTLGTRMATFSYRKALDFPMFQKSWSAAETLLRSADRWVFVGYSLPAADFEFKYLLKRIQLSRRRQPELVIVSGGTKTDVRLTYSNYHKFFGRSVTKPRFFSSGLTQEAIRTICSPAETESFFG